VRQRGERLDGHFFAILDGAARPGDGDVEALGPPVFGFTARSALQAAPFHVPVAITVEKGRAATKRQKIRRSMADFRAIMGEPRSRSCVAPTAAQPREGAVLETPGLVVLCVR
jgi:hypothetical protein